MALIGPGNVVVVRMECKNTFLSLCFTEQSRSLLTDSSEKWSSTGVEITLFVKFKTTEGILFFF